MPTLKNLLQTNLLLIAFLALAKNSFAQEPAYGYRSASDAGASTASAGSLVDPNIRYIGRWDFSNPSEYTSFWGGAYLKVSFTGTTVAVKIANPGNSYFASIDGGPWISYLNAPSTINLTPQPLASGVHTVSIAEGKDYDYLFAFQGFILDAGAITMPPISSQSLIEFIGDSITAGYTDAQADVSDYGWVTAQALGAEHTQIAYPGINLVSGYATAGMDVDYFNLENPSYTSSPSWMFSVYTPQVVVINLGTNDADNRVPDDVFESSYTNLLQSLRARFPNAELFALETFAALKAAPTSAAVSTRVAAGDAHVHYIDTTGWITKSDTNDGTHPSVSGHIKIAKLLEPILQPYVYRVNVPTACSVITSGQGLLVGQSQKSCDGRFTLTLTQGGNLVLAEGTQQFFSTNTANTNAVKAVMQGDGNFVLYNSGGSPVWDTNTQSSSAAVFDVQNDGNLVVYRNSTPVWASNTCCR